MTGTPKEVAAKLVEKLKFEARVIRQLKLRVDS